MVDVETENSPHSLAGGEVPGLDVIVDLVTIFILCDGEPGTVRHLEHVLVEVHDEVDSAGQLHIQMAVCQEEEMTVVRNNQLIILSTTAILDVAPVVDVRLWCERLWVILAAHGIWWCALLLASCCMVVGHVMHDQLAVVVLIRICCSWWELSRDHLCMGECGEEEVVK